MYWFENFKIIANWEIRLSQKISSFETKKKTKFKDDKLYKLLILAKCCVKFQKSIVKSINLGQKLHKF